MKRAILMVFAAVAALGQGIQTGPFSASTNFTVDISGAQDNRPGTWGTSGVQTWSMKFYPPAGYLVRILHVHGDLTAMVRQPQQMIGQAGVLWGLGSTVAPNQGDSARVQYSGEGTFLYVQGVLTPTQPLTRAVDYDTSVGGLLGSDNTLIVKVAAFLNDTGAAIHLEPTFTMVFEWVPIQGGN